jgi:hypothetical protein
MSLFPYARYRPLPIVWFTGALVDQVLALFVTYFALYGSRAIYTIAVSAVLTVGIGYMTWRRGMKGAGLGWRVGTVAALLFNLALISMGAEAGPRFPEPQEHWVKVA